MLAKYFHSVSTSPDASQQFTSFLAQHPIQSLIVKNTPWRFRLCGQGDTTLLLLPGLPGLGFTSFPDVLFFEPRFRLLLPDYPAHLHTVDALATGLCELLEALHIPRVALIGGSYGALAALAFAECYPEKVSRLVLSHSSLPRKSRALLLDMLIPLIICTPERPLSFCMHTGLPLFMRTFPDPEGLWYLCFKQVLDTLHKADYMARLRVHRDFDRNYTFSAPASWTGPTLLLAADNDPYATGEEQARLQRRYPQASLHVFHQTAHYAWACEPLAYFSLIQAFLEP